jgi:CNT family concentrative nucleoside transporter
MAAAQGAQTGVKLAVAVGAMVLAFVALVALANGLLGGHRRLVRHPDLSFQRIVGYVFAPVMFLIGVPWNEAGSPAGCSAPRSCSTNSSPSSTSAMMGARRRALSDRSRAIVTFALCGFANFSSIAIQMAVTGGLAPTSGR